MFANLWRMNDGWWLYDTPEIEGNRAQEESRDEAIKAASVVQAIQNIYLLNHHWQIEVIGSNRAVNRLHRGFTFIEAELLKGESALLVRIWDDGEGEVQEGTFSGEFGLIIWVGPSNVRLIFCRQMTPNYRPSSKSEVGFTFTAKNGPKRKAT